MTANIDECVLSCRSKSTGKLVSGSVELPGPEAVEHKPLTEELGVELLQRLLVQTGAIDGEARCDRGQGTSSSCSKVWL